MSTGLVKFFNNAKGYGFIKEDDSDTEHFVHVTGLIDSITEGDKVKALKGLFFCIKLYLV